jgi:RimJ/RimL family protein N-acetyltransferase
MSAIALLALNYAAATALANDPAAFATQHGLTLDPHAETAVAIATNTVAMLTPGGPPTPWGGYLAVAELGNRVVGAGGFKQAPDADGAVEIAYFTFPGEEGRGVATALAMALVDVARTAGSGVAVVRAHTLPERDASCRVLEKARFHQTGTVIDPDDGPVWRWEHSLQPVQ